MENNKFEKSSSSANSDPTGWESLEVEDRRHDLMLRVKSKFTAEKFKRAASIAMLGLMTAATISAGKSDTNTVERTMSTATEADLSDPRTAQENINENISNEELADLISTHSKVNYDVTNGREGHLGETPTPEPPKNLVEANDQPITHPDPEPVFPNAIQNGLSTNSLRREKLHIKNPQKYSTTPSVQVNAPVPYLPSSPNEPPSPNPEPIPEPGRQGILQPKSEHETFEQEEIQHQIKPASNQARQEFETPGVD